MSMVHDLTPPKADGLKRMDLKGVEKWREYVFGGTVYRIENPVAVYFKPGGTTHRVVDDKGIAHCVPAVGVNGCALRWESVNPEEPVKY